MTYQTEFPDFPAADMPTIPPEYDFVDTSWHNDTCPSFASDKLGLWLFIDFADIQKREIQEQYPRFNMRNQEAGVEMGTWAVESDDFNVILEAMRQRAVERGLAKEG